MSQFLTDMFGSVVDDPLLGDDSFMFSLPPLPLPMPAVVVVKNTNYTGDAVHIPLIDDEEKKFGQLAKTLQPHDTYAARKAIAQRRVRVGGRFVSKAVAEAIRNKVHQGEETGEEAQKPSKPSKPNKKRTKKGGHWTTSKKSVKTKSSS